MISLPQLSIKAGSSHIKSLDGVRGLAILLVLALHFFGYFRWVAFGWMGVDLFFVLSGFLITGILLDSKHHKHYYRNFIVRRILRIFPLYYFFLIVFFFLLPLLGWSDLFPHFGYLYLNQNWFWFYLQNWLAAFDAGWPMQNVLSPFWSLAIEEQFYVFWPFVILLFPRRKIILICSVLIALSLALRFIFYMQDLHWTYSYIITVTRLDGLCFGAILARMVRTEEGIRFLNAQGSKLFVGSVIALLLTLLAAGNFYIDNPTLYTIGYSVIALCFACLVAVTLSNHSGNVIRRIFESPALIFLGKYSYGIYIYHKPIYQVLLVKMEMYSIHNPLLVSVMGITITLLVSYASFNLMEAQFLKLKDKLAHHAAPKADKIVL